MSGPRSTSAAFATRRPLAAVGFSLVLSCFPVMAFTPSAAADPAIATKEPTQAESTLSLIMFESSGCHWCERWNEEIGPVYPKTAEGRAAPLERRDIYAPLPENLDLTRRPAFTPTFVLVRDGRELGRIEGYPGEDFFWPLLDQLIEKAGAGDDKQLAGDKPSGT